MSEKKDNYLVLKIVLGVAGGIILAIVVIMLIIGLLANKAENEIDSVLNERRKMDVIGVVTQITNYQASNNGKLPATVADIKRYLDTYFTDPDGNVYEISLETLNEGESKAVAKFDHTMYIMLKGKCSGEKAVYSANKRDYAVLYHLDGKTTYCVDNQ